MIPAWNIPGAVGFRHALRAGARHKFSEADVGPDDLAFLQYTGGTTGVPKGAMLTHGNMVANMQQLSAWVRPFLNEGSEAAVMALPLYHIFALTASLTFMKTRGRQYPDHQSARYSGLRQGVVATEIHHSGRRQHAFQRAPAQSRFRASRFQSLKLSVGGGMSVQRAVAEQWKAVTGNKVIEAYGLTEASPASRPTRSIARRPAARLGCHCQTPISSFATMTATTCRWARRAMTLAGWGLISRRQIPTRGPPTS